MPEFNINSIMNSRSKAAPVELEVVKKPLNMLRPSKKNMFSMDEIRELADQIELVGLLQPGIVKAPDADGISDITAGHRRYAAYQLLYSEGKEKYAEFPCVVSDEESENITTLKMMISNKYREYTDAEKVYMAEEVRKALEGLQEEGVVFEGRMRDYVAKILKTSATQVARMEVISKHATPDVKKALEEGTMGFTAAYETARKKDPEEQKAALEAYKQGGGIKAVKGGKKSRIIYTTPTPEPAAETPSLVAPLPRACDEERDRILPVGFSCVWMSDGHTLLVYYPEGKRIATQVKNSDHPGALRHPSPEGNIRED